ncbi:hypothetical protein FZW96_07315 [Bacillus sp. BGMRC 2118]|nr:hypothetical protein FZW96_07315 [Bacillus sp. BGMRC 2118]
MSSIHHFILDNTIYILIYLIIGAVFGVSMALYKTAEGIQKQSMDDPDTFLNILILPFFIMLLYPVFLAIVLIFYVMIEIDQFIIRRKK